MRHPFANGCAASKASLRWSPRQESNLYLALRRHLFYPLNYGEDGSSGEEPECTGARRV